MTDFFRVKVKYISLLVLVFSMMSCLDINTSIKLKRDGRVDVSLSYRFMAELADFGRGFGADEPWPFPLTEKDFRQQALRISGVALIRYRVRTESDGSERIDVRLKADSMESLASYLGLDMVIQDVGEGKSLVLTIPPVDHYPGADVHFREVFEKIVGKSTFRISFRPPERPLSSDPGYIDGKSAVLSLSLLDILYQKNAGTWIVRW